MSGPDFAALANPFLERVRHYLSTDEWRYASEYPAPVITAGTDDDGDVVLVVNYAGSTWQTGWDGTAEDARASVEAAAVTLADDISSDYWRTEGWRGRTRSE